MNVKELTKIAGVKIRCEVQRIMLSSIMAQPHLHIRIHKSIYEKHDKVKEYFSFDPDLDHPYVYMEAVVPIAALCNGLKTIGAEEIATALLAHDSRLDVPNIVSLLPLFEKAISNAKQVDDEIWFYGSTLEENKEYILECFKALQTIDAAGGFNDQPNGIKALVAPSTDGFELVFAPDGWSLRLTDDGRIYYANDVERTTQWVHPLKKTSSVWK